MNKKVKIVIDNKIPFIQGVLDKNAEVEYLKYSEMTKNIIADKDALIIRTRTICNQSLLDNTNVKFIATATIGHDHIDHQYCKEKNIKWINAPGCNSSSVMQYMASALVTIADKKKFDLDKMTIGIIGVGNVGKKVEKLSRILGMNVLLNDPPRMRKEGSEGFVELDELLLHSDIITFHVPLIKEGIDKTFHMVDNSFFAKQKNAKIIINASRGPVIDTNSLMQAIREKHVNGCILDVWENEPNINKELLEMVDIATPHIAGYSADGKANGTAICINGVNSFFKLGLKENWYPEKIPDSVNNKEFSIDCSNMRPQDVIKRVILYSYNILDDNKRLKNSPDAFEEQRGNYPIRREFPYYKIKLINCDEITNSILARLGFRTD